MQAIMMSGQKNNSYIEAEDVMSGLNELPGFLAAYIEPKEFRVISFHEDAHPSCALEAGQKRVHFIRANPKHDLDQNQMQKSRNKISP